VRIPLALLLLALPACGRDSAPPPSGPDAIQAVPPLASTPDALSTPTEPEDQVPRLARAWWTRRLSAAKADMARALAEAKGDDLLRAEAIRRFDAQTGAINETYYGVKAVFDANKPTAGDIEQLELMLQMQVDSIVGNLERRLACMKEAALLTDPEAAKKKQAECEEESRMHRKFMEEGWADVAALLEMYVSIAR
jgi:hypothetical protein